MLRHGHCKFPRQVTDRVTRSKRGWARVSKMDALEVVVRAATEMDLPAINRIHNPEIVNGTATVSSRGR